MKILLPFPRHHKNTNPTKRWFLTLLKEAGVPLKLKQCAFLTNLFNYLSHVIKHGGLKVVNHTAEAKRKPEILTTVSELRSFLLQCNKVRPFFSDFARISLPLSKRLKKTKEKELERLEKGDIKELNVSKEKLFSPPVLTPVKKKDVHTGYRHM